MAGVGTADEEAASGTSDRATVPSGVSTVIYMVLEMRDGDKSKTSGRGCILKAVANIIDVIAHKLLGMDVWEQPEIDKLLVENPEGSKYEWCWFRANFSANVTLAISTTVCRAGAAKSEVRFYTYISKFTDKFMMPVLCFNVTSGERHAGNCLACPEFLIVPTGAGNVAEDMITDTGVNHTLKFSGQEDERRCVQRWRRDRL